MSLLDSVQTSALPEGPSGYPPMKMNIKAQMALVKVPLHPG